MAIDWSAIFDESHPNPGASETVIAQLLDEITRPLTEAEIQTANAVQRNPYPTSDRLHATWQPFDPATWCIPSRPLPATYLSLLRRSDGGEFRTGERWFQFLPALGERAGVRAVLLAYHIPQYMPGAVPIAWNGGGTFYMLDLRQPAVRGEYPIVCAHAGFLGWGPPTCRVVAHTLEAACRGTINVEDMLYSAS